MSKKNQYILLLTTFIFVVIVGIYYVVYIGETPIVGPRGLVVEIQTDRDAYVLGEEIEISIYLYNDRLRPVRIEQGELIVETRHRAPGTTRRASREDRARRINC